MNRKYIAEFLGTFFLVFAGTGAIIADAMYGGIGYVGIALVFGLTVMAVIYSVGNISGAHINPAVSIGFWLAGRLTGKRMFAYVMAQFAGGIAASAVLLLLFPGQEGYGVTLPSGLWWKSAVLEFIMTFFLMFVILNVSSGSKETGIMAGAAVGAAVCLNALLGGVVSGASMNPARSLGPAIVSLNFDYLWLYFFAPVAGGAFAVLAIILMHEKKQVFNNKYN